MLDLVARHKGVTREAAFRWLSDKGFTDPEPQHASRVVARYRYTDEVGTLLLEVCRLEPKSFRQRRPDGHGGWTWKLGDVRRVLYRLPQLIAAPPDAIVLVTEGEKDADRLASEGVVATTSSGGA